MIQTFPNAELIEEYANLVPAYMRPNLNPYAVVLEGILTDEECNRILDRGMRLEPYNFSTCGAITREFDPGHFSLAQIENVALGMNNLYWNYDLDERPVSWMQTYETGTDYKIHTDTAPGQTRKLTAIALLSDPTEYDGGKLVIHAEPFSFAVPRTRGTIVVFQPWLLHEVTNVSDGIRQTINMGFWGPPFK